jgi:type II secretory pathway pseudopilin PulG
MNTKTGITLSEILTVLIVLGIITSFTIPKLMHNSQQISWNTGAKDAMSTLSQAIQSLRNENKLRSTSSFTDLLPYMNYASLDNSSLMNGWTVNGWSVACSAMQHCVRLHNGGVIYGSFWTFGGTSNLHVLQVFYDPDGRYMADSGAALIILLYFNGLTHTRRYALPSSNSDGNIFGPDTTLDPDWFRGFGE